MPQKLYGHNQVFCQGKLISGPDARSSILSTLMIVLPSILWQVFVGTFFAVEYSFIVPLLVASLQVSSVILLFATAFSDPGIMPRQKDCTEYYDERTKVFRTREPQRFYDLVLRGQPFKIKYCKTCNIYRPPRCTHCSVCENCVERFDHHCPWLGNCIGKRNYWLFYAFVSTTGVLNMATVATSLSHIVILCLGFQEDGETGGGEAFLSAITHAPMSAALVIYSLGIVWFTVGLCTYHNYLVCTNQTTYEQIKGAFADATNPFHRGIIANYQEIVFSPVRPCYFNAFTNRLIWPPRGALAMLVKPPPPPPEASGFIGSSERNTSPRPSNNSGIELELGPRGGAHGSPQSNGRSSSKEPSGRTVQQSSQSAPQPLPLALTKAEASQERRETEVAVEQRRPTLPQSNEPSMSQQQKTRRQTLDMQPPRQPTDHEPLPEPVAPTAAASEQHTASLPEPDSLRERSSKQSAGGHYL